VGRKRGKNRRFLKGEKAPVSGTFFLWGGKKTGSVHQRRGKGRDSGPSGGGEGGEGKEFFPGPLILKEEKEKIQRAWPPPKKGINKTYTTEEREGKKERRNTPVSSLLRKEKKKKTRPGPSRSRWRHRKTPPSGRRGGVSSHVSCPRTRKKKERKNQGYAHLEEGRGGKIVNQKSEQHHFISWEKKKEDRSWVENPVPCNDKGGREPLIHL